MGERDALAALVARRFMGARARATRQSDSRWPVRRLSGGKFYATRAELQKLIVLWGRRRPAGQREQSSIGRTVAHIWRPSLSRAGRATI